MEAGLYVHVPFCTRVCPYCDFAVLTGGEAKRAAYVTGLLREIELVAREGFADGARFATVYLGGGTPSALDADQLASIVAALRRELPVAEEAWLTLEANPEDVTSTTLAAWRELGFRTLSLGVQSFDDDTLGALGRAHSGAQAREAVAAACGAGFDIVSVDLMFGLQDQTPGEWREDLATAVDLGPEHMSCYQLTLHEGTPFGAQQARGERHEMPDDEQAELYALAHAVLGAAGYEGYEVSNFARDPDHRSRHNAAYWRHAPYLGLGPSAHSFDGSRARWWNERRLADYVSALAAGRPIAGREELSDESLLVERILFGTRSRAGLDLDAIEADFGVDLEALNTERLAAWRQEGLVEGRRLLRPTVRGLAVADWLAAALRTR